jgi:hypothetical protein
MTPRAAPLETCHLDERAVSGQGCRHLDRDKTGPIEEADGRGRGDRRFSRQRRGGAGSGGTGNDELSGGLGLDRLTGAEGADFLAGDRGRHELYGGRPTGSSGATGTTSSAAATPERAYLAAKRIAAIGAVALVGWWIYAGTDDKPANPPQGPSNSTAYLNTDYPKSSTATAVCMDGTYSYAAHHQGACSWHGGVAQWLSP